MRLFPPPTAAGQVGAAAREQSRHRHPEPKSLDPDGTPCRPDSHGLLAHRPVTATEISYIGKESNRTPPHMQPPVSTACSCRKARHGIQGSAAD